MPITLDELRKMISTPPEGKKETFEKVAEKSSVKDVKASFVEKLNLSEPDKPRKKPKPVEIEIPNESTSDNMPTFAEAVEYLKERFALGDESKYFLKVYAYAESKNKLTPAYLLRVGKAMIEEPIEVMEHKIKVYKQFDDYLFQIKEIESITPDGKVLNKCSVLRDIINQYKDKGSLTIKQFRFAQKLARELGL